MQKNKWWQLDRQQHQYNCTRVDRASVYMQTPTSTRKKSYNTLATIHLNSCCWWREIKSMSKTWWKLGGVNHLASNIRGWTVYSFCQSNAAFTNVAAGERGDWMSYQCYWYQWTEKRPTTWELGPSPQSNQHRGHWLYLHRDWASPIHQIELDFWQAVTSKEKFKHATRSGKEKLIGFKM